MSDEPVRVLFLCTHNSARSQMAEGMLRAWGDGRFEAFSAGTIATGVRREAIAVMDEIGIDLSGHVSKTLDAVAGRPFDWLITVCDQARDSCPVLPGVREQAHWSVDDPSAIEGDDELRLQAFRAARERLRERIELFIRDGPSAEPGT